MKEMKKKLTVPPADPATLAPNVKIAGDPAVGNSGSLSDEFRRVHGMPAGEPALGNSGSLTGRLLHGDRAQFLEAVAEQLEMIDALRTPGTLPAIAQAVLTLALTHMRSLELQHPKFLEEIAAAIRRETINDAITAIRGHFIAYMGAQCQSVNSGLAAIERILLTVIGPVSPAADPDDSLKPMLADVVVTARQEGAEKALQEAALFVKDYPPRELDGPIAGVLDTLARRIAQLEVELS